MNCLLIKIVFLNKYSMTCNKFILMVYNEIIVKNVRI